MSVAYRTSEAFDYRGHEERAVYGEQTDARAAARAAAHRQTVMARRVVVMVVTVIAAAVCIGLLYVKAQVYMVQRDINNTQKQIDQVERQNSILQEQYNEAMDINTIMDKATQLGMGYPSTDQVLYVNLTGKNDDVTMKK